MSELDVYSILIARVYYKDGTGSKVRPAVVIKFNNQIIRTYRITSQFHNKSDEIRRHYFEILDWYQAGLKKPSWIDTINYYDMDNDSSMFKIRGYLTERDVNRLIDFLADK